MAAALGRNRRLRSPRQRSAPAVLCARMVQTSAGLQRHASDRLGQLRPTRRTSRDQTWRESARLDRRKHRAHARTVEAPGYQLRLGARDRGAPTGVLQMGPVVFSEDVGTWTRVQEGLAGELVSQGTDRTVERAIIGRDLLALWYAGREARSRAVVPAHHGLRGTARRRHETDRGWLARQGFEASERLGRSQ